MSILSAPYFHNEAAAFAKVEAALWADGPVCPHCGCMGRISAIKPNVEKRVRMGLKKCGDCQKQFTVRIGTIFEESKLPLHIWLQAIHLMCSSKKGVSAHQLHRTLEITYKSAWFLAHRIREAMRSGDLTPFGQTGGAVEVDETFIGRVKGKEVRNGYQHKMKVLSLIYRETGGARSMVIDTVTTAEIAPIVRENVAREARLMTDEARHYVKVGREFTSHGVVRHMDNEYVRYVAQLITTNTIEGLFSIFKRGMKGTYQHCSDKHLNRYLAEFDFRYCERAANGVDDTQRAAVALQGVVGKRLTYRSANDRL
jgi:transposase-like protein